MNKIYKPELLTDKTRLQEIYDLRVTAYENSANSNIVNRRIFPNGWFDNFDLSSFHWIIEKNSKIVASARLTYFNNINDLRLIGIDISGFEIEIKYPFGLISRLVIEKSLRGQGLAKQFDTCRINQMKKDQVSLCFAEAREERIKQLNGSGFINIGKLQFNASFMGDTEMLNLMIWKNGL